MPVENGPERALVVMAHPDDADFSCAGTVATWTHAGVGVTYLMVTDGDAGGDDRTGDGVDMATTRRAEQSAAAELVGVRDVRFLGYPDGRLMPSLELRRDIARVIRQVRPHRMIIPSPDRDWSHIAPSHPDHLATGEAAINAVYPDARNPHAHPELASENLAPWVVPEVWLVHGSAPNHYCDITDVIEQKIGALAAHASQISDISELDAALREWLGKNAAAGGLGEDRLAEVFQIVNTA
ncbi:LmbE family N-acetylglucosaminyl deacetylase [Lipingzhangella halophila]|uniref:LmbE family N-acetylglucosaminyl deacetylase n=1 Tax=Lipingzhangella halophila TaxID=1783352 RepID=A0A7W7RJE3_9ACTN|nr:PIG-L deacetylase family protein [Lipingzhangella halophila]MBB4933055.1 LmbE family N-acetylglucosaminyl deacetylase [Lipingzhangella halophila]